MKFIKKVFSKEFFWRDDVKVLNDLFVILCFALIMPNGLLGKYAKIALGKYGVGIMYFFLCILVMVTFNDIFIFLLRRFYRK